MFLRTREESEELGPRLLEKVLRDPDDEASRLIFIDHLLEQRDLRGEYLELAERFSRASPLEVRTLSPVEIDRMNELLNRHEEAWLGPLSHVTARDSRRYHRGYLDSCELTLSAPSDLDGVVGAPEWSTVSRVERAGKARAKDLARLILATRFPRLRVVGVLDGPTLTEVATTPSLHKIEEVSFYVVNPRPGTVFTPPLEAALREAPGLPALKRLFVGFVKRTPEPFRVEDVVLSWLWASPLAKRLEVVGVSLDSPGGLAEWLASLSAHTTSIRELQILPALAVGPPSLLHTFPGEHITLRSDDKRRFSRLIVREVGSQPDTDLTEALARLPEDALTHVDLREVRQSRIGGLLRVLENQRRLAELALPRATFGGGSISAQQQTTTLVVRLRARGVRITFRDA